MPFIFKRLALLLSIASAFAADKDAPFRAAPAGSYEHHQTSEQVTIGVDPYDGGEKVRVAFGKLDPYQLGILPVLVVIQNDTNKTLSLEHLTAQYVGPSRNKVEATPAKDVRFIRGPQRPGMIPGPTGQIKVIKGKKNPLDAWEIEGRAISAKMLTAGQTASGFLYFQTGLQPGSVIYLSGITEAASGKELFYFEIPLK
jgi:hypothetical protein